MTTERLGVGPADVERAATLLRSGQLVAIPTETVYGLAAVIGDEAALRSIFDAKGRPQDNPLIVHVADASAVAAVAVVDHRAALLLAAFAPGPLTLVLPRQPSVSSIVTAGLATVAVRVPDLDVTRQIIRAAGQPLAAPSANRSGRPSPTTAGHVVHDLDGRIAAVVDAGPCRAGIESTVVGLADGQAVLLRPGAVPASAIEDVLQAPLRRATTADGGSPGMRHRHYAPDAPLELLWSASALEERKRVCEHAGERLYVIVPRQSTLYAELRTANDLHVDRILVLCDGTIRADEALMNRLYKAAESSPTGMNDRT